MSRSAMAPLSVRTHTAVPAAAFAALCLLFSLTDLDRELARAWAFDGELGIFPARNAWWSTELLHRGGKYAVWGIGAAALSGYLASYRLARWREWRRPALFAFVAMALATLAVAVLKTFTNVDCPWDLEGFGGSRPYVHLFADRPDDLPKAACFPGAHSSSGFALMAFYFVFRERWPRLARVALGAGIVVGAAFSFGQQARGAHFLSHDLTSAFLVWFVELGLYAGGFGGRLWGGGAAGTGPAATNASVSPRQLVVDG